MYETESFKHCGRWLIRAQRERSAEMPGCGRKDCASFPPPRSDPIAPSVSITSHNCLKIRCQQYCGTVKSKLHSLVYLPRQCQPEGSLQVGTFPLAVLLLWRLMFMQIRIVPDNSFRSVS